jgi:23S rRNA pseudouridine1911/1915/1917 synthase
MTGAARGGAATAGHAGAATHVPTVRLIASTEDAGQRLDVFLAARLAGLSRSQAQRLIREGHVTAGGAGLRANTTVAAGLTVDVAVPAAAPSPVTPEPLPLTVLYDDANMAVVDKPGGMVVHPGAGHARGTLVNALLHHLRGLSGIGGRERPGIVHRLDRGTSGVMVIAKHDRAHQALSRQFHDRTVRKEYLALVWGRPHEGRTFDQPIGRDPHHRQKISSRARAPRPASTTLVAVEPLGAVSLVRLIIGTGRTHQIRVHLSEAGHPVVGDATYGGVRKRVPAELAAVARLDRPFLHASTLTLTHPEHGRLMSFEAPLPEDLAGVLGALRRVRDARRRRHDAKET